MGRDNQASVKVVLTGLQRLSEMEELDLNGNNITAESVPLLCATLKAMPSLRELMLQNNSVGDSGALELAKCVAANNKNLQTIWLQNNQLTTDAKRAFKAELSTLKNLSRIELGES